MAGSDAAGGGMTLCGVAWRGVVLGGVVRRRAASCCVAGCGMVRHRFPEGDLVEDSPVDAVVVGLCKRAVELVSCCGGGLRTVAVAGRGSAGLRAVAQSCHGGGGLRQWAWPCPAHHCGHNARGAGELR